MEAQELILAHTWHGGPARRALPPNIPLEEFPGQALVADLYLKGGTQAVGDRTLVCVPATPLCGCVSARMLPQVAEASVCATSPSQKVDLESNNLIANRM